MTLPELSIRRHVFAFMVNAVLILFGLIAYTRIGVDKLPYIEFPVVSVTTNQRGANPELDSAVALRPAILDFLRQDRTAAVNYADAVGALARVTGAPAADAAKH